VLAALPAALVIALPAALVAACAVALSLPPAPPVYPPEVCSWVSHDGNVSEFCIQWNPALGRYNDPPPGVPADFATNMTRSATRTAQPDTTQFAVAAVVFTLVFIGLWAVLSIISRVDGRANGRA
jgi:hypothetical protein